MLTILELIFVILEKSRMGLHVSFYMKLGIADLISLAIINYHVQRDREYIH